MSRGSEGGHHPRARHIYVLDTNVLMHDPAALYRFQEHDLFLPMVVLEELDAAKKGVSEVARNVRQVSRSLDALIDGADQQSIEAGLPLPAPEGLEAGRLFFQTRANGDALPPSLPGTVPDNSILNAALTLRESHPDRRVALVSKDINLRIKAQVLGIDAEDYRDDMVLEDVNLLYSGVAPYPEGFWDGGVEIEETRREGNGTVYVVVAPEPLAWFPNECLFSPEEPRLDAVVREVDGVRAVLALARDFRSTRHTIWGVNARNREQNFALNVLLDPEIDFVTVLGTAGTGKTLLALAAGLAQTLEDKRYREVVMTRVTVPVGDDIGFLPGTEEEKMTPWMGALMDNLEVLTQSDTIGEWGRAAANDLLQSRVKIRSLNFMRGRTFLNRYLIIDEAQNLTRKQMKTLVTRAGPGTKVVCLGNVAQIDTPYLSETTSGLTYAVDRFKDWPHAAHVTLRRGERSRLADRAAEVL